jgi:ATP-dependent Lhr-like helicase
MAWRVNDIDWQRRVAYVEATEAKGSSRWQGDRPGLGFRMCQSIKHLLAGDEDGAMWSRRARQQIHDIRQAHTWLDEHSTVVVRGESEPAEWWTFAGSGANAMLAYELSQATQSVVDHNSFTVTFEPHISRKSIEQALDMLRAGGVSPMRAAVDEQAIEGLKFSACLPHELALDMLQSRISDPASLQWVLKQPVKNFI